MVGLHAKLKALINNRWLVFVCAIWVQCGAGVGYMFGDISSVIKSSMGYNQKQVSILGVAKDLGDNFGLVAGSLCQTLPIWAILLTGVVHNFVGYGLLWLIVTHRLPTLPLWVLCLSIFIGTNGETYYNTATLVSCIQNFPKSRGPIVGILKGFCGLSGAMLTQFYDMINSSDESSLILMIAVGPSIIVIAFMFIIRHVEGHKQTRPSDTTSFLFTYGVCLVLAAYLMVVLLLEDQLNLSQSLLTLLSTLLIIILLLPIMIPIVLVFFFEPKSPLLEDKDQLQTQEAGTSQQEENKYVLSEVDDEISSDVDSLPSSERQKRIAQVHAKLCIAVAEGAVRANERDGPHRGENFTLMQALKKAEFWLIFLSLILGAGSGLTVIDNMGQISSSLNYNDSSIFVSLISICNFLGRVGGGYFSETFTRKFASPRPVTLAVIQVMMAVGLFYYAMGWPGEIYAMTVLVSLGYGAHWAIFPASISEIFGMENFGAFYNVLTLASPVGSLIFSSVIASSIYDYYAERQAEAALQLHYSRATSVITHLKGDSLSCEGSICYSITLGILSGLCIVAALLTLIVVYRTKKVYAQFYDKSSF